MELIDKSVIAAEIERRKKIVEKRLYINNSYSEEGNAAWKRDKALYDAYNYLLSFINTLAVKEVDLEKEIGDWYNTKGILVTTDALKETARHFFELGLKAQKGE